MKENLILPSAIEGELDARVSAELREAYFPEPGIATELAQLSLFASLETEEKRQVRFSLAYTRPELGESESSSCWNAVRFESPRPLTKIEIVKLAPALDPELSSIGIFGESGSLQIWGILNHGASIKRMTRDERGGASMFPPWAVPFIIKAVASGTLSFWLGDYQIMVVVRGTVHEPCGNLFGRCGLISKFIGNSAQLFNGNKSLLQDQLNRLFRRMVRKLKELGHGGTIIISQCPDPQDFGIGRNGWLDNDAIGKRLTERIAEMEREIHPIRETGILPNSHGEIPRRITAQSDWLHDAIDAMVMLSQIDGALIISSDLNIKSFGSIIKIDPALEFQTSICSDTEGLIRQSYDLSLRGTRHRSAAFYCASHPEALAFVQSDDGTLSVFKGYEKGHVLCWQNVEPDRVFTIRDLERLVSGGAYLLPRDMFFDGKQFGPSLHRF